METTERSFDLDSPGLDSSSLPGSAGDTPVTDVAIPGYTLEGRIGVGGMGEVILARDLELRRDVAIKRLRNANALPTTIERFLREARIQARLDHPAIVPVHASGTDSTGQPYFTMTRLVGTTLAHHLKARTKTQQELLRAFVDVCFAIDFAHGRKVVHRDIKPANIMLGEYREVYVMDWGVARIVDEPEPAPGDSGPAGAGDATTHAGMLLGTPGYMPPEQVTDASAVGPAADVYALGATLFEILTGTRLHPPGGNVIASTLEHRDRRPSQRAPERQVPPELDWLCADALALDAAQRPSARVLAQGVQRYLDGDRDIEGRRTLAQGELAAAQLALSSGNVTRRAEAMRAAGRALALDPESREAAALVTRLMLEPPPVHPAELTADLAASDAAMQQNQGRIAVKSLLAVLAFLVIASTNGLRSVPVMAAIFGWTAIVLGIVFVFSRRVARTSEMWLICIINAVLGALLSRLFGPLIIAPLVTCIMAVSLTSYPQLMEHARAVIAVLIIAWLGPVLLEAAGVLAPTWRAVDGAVISTSHVIVLSPVATSLLLVFGNCLAIAVVAKFANALARSRREAQRRVEIQAWHLKQLLPLS